MADVKWIKLLTSLPDDEKLKTIKLMPDRFAIFYVWIMLLIQAGKCNAGGMIYLSDGIPYTEEQLANQFDMPVNTLRLALLTYQKLEMIEIKEDGNIFIPNFSVIQNIEGLEKIREQTRLRVQKFRQKPKLLNRSNATVALRNTNVTQQNKNKNKNKNLYKYTYGTFKNIKLTDNEVKKLKERFGNKGFEDRVETLSHAIESKGYKYKSHYATILAWERKNGTHKPSDKKSKPTGIKIVS